MAKNQESLIKILVLVFILTIDLAFVMKADAYIPVTYTCCHNDTYSDGTLLNGFESPGTQLDNGIKLDNFENLSNWTVGGTYASQQADTINFEEGTQGLKLIATNGYSATIDKAINNDFSTTNNFGIWIYVYNLSTFKQGNLYITSTGTAWSKYFITYIGGLKQGWNKLIFDKNSFSNNGGENWNNTMNRIRLRIYPSSTNNLNVTFDDLRYNLSNDWISGTLQPDTINFKEGLQGLKLISTNGSLPYMDLQINNNFSTTNNFAIWTYVDNASNLNSISIYISSNGSTMQKYFLDSEWKAVKTGWNKLVFNKNNFKNYFNESWDNVMNRIRLRTYPSATNNINVTFDDLRYDMKGQRAKLMIEFDDGDLSAYTKAYPILNGNNQSGVSFVVKSFVGTDPTNNMNLTHLKILQNAGWDISSHTVDHVDLTAVSESTLTSELNDSYDWLVSNNFQKSAGFIAYPYGTFNDAVLNKVKQRYIFGRATKPEIAQQYFASDDSIQYIQREISAHNDTSVQSIKDDINDTIDSKLLEMLVFHNVADNLTSDIYTYLTEDLQKVSDYIKSRSADIDVITYSDLVIPNINSFTPVINKTTRIYSNGSSILITKNKYDEYMPNTTVRPSSGSIDVGITTYDETGGLIKFNESSPNSDIQVSYDIGDRIPNQPYRVIIYWANGTKYQDFNVLADSTGYIKYISEGFGDSRYQEINIISQRLSFNIFYNVI